jgi:DNA transposition AAA+ family ATPase
MKLPHEAENDRKGLYNDKFVVRIIDEINAYKTASKKSWDEIATLCGIPKGTLSSLANKTYAGKVLDKCHEVENWLRSQREGEKIRGDVKSFTGYIQTPSSHNFWSLLSFAQLVPDITVIATSSGLGKTETIEEYKRTNPNVWLITGEPYKNTVNKVLDQILVALNMKDVFSKDPSEDIKNRLRGTSGLLIVDEAQNYTTEQLDQIRVYYDQCGIGIVFAGNHQVSSKLTGGGVANFATLKSRVGMKLSQKDLKKGDAEALISGYGITEPALRKQLIAVSKKPGALRTMRKTLIAATLVARGANEELTSDHISHVYSQIDTGEGGGRV